MDLPHHDYPSNFIKIINEEDITVVNCNTTTTSTTAKNNNNNSIKRKARYNSTSENAPLHVQFYPDESQSSVSSESDDDNDDIRTSSSSSSSSPSTRGIRRRRPPSAPDGGWGWVVVAASFLVNLIGDGITFSFGIIFVEFLNYFGEGKGKTAWIAGLFMAMPLLSGPIASFLADRFGCRKVAIFGAVLAALGFVISSVANSMAVLLITFGVFAGFGLSLCYVAAIVIVAYYFDKRRSFATGLSVCGSGIGTFVFAPLTQHLLAEYGWRGTVLILAGFFLNICVCGALMRDELPWLEISTKKRRDREERQKKRKPSSYRQELSSAASSFSHMKEASISQNGWNGLTDLPETEIMMMMQDNNRLSNSLLSIPTFVRNGERVPPEVLELLSSHRSVYNRLLANYPSLLLSSRSVSESRHLAGNITNEQFTAQSVKSAPPLTLSPTTATTSTPKAASRSSPRSLPPPTTNSATNQNQRFPTAYLKDLRVHRHSLTYRGAMLNINRYRLRASSCPDIYRNSMTTIAKEKHEWYSGVWEFYKLLTEMLDLSYFLDMQFLLFALSNFLLYAWYDVPYVYLADSAIEMGFSETDSSFLISIIGIVNMVGEIVLGWVGDRPGIDPTFIYACCMFLCGGATALFPLLPPKSYTALCVASGAFGLFISANYSLTSIILVELISIDRFTNAYGLLLLVQGIANLVGPPLAGWIYDVTNSYDLTFYLSGLFIALSGLLLLILPAVNAVRAVKRALKRKKRQKQQNNNNNLQSSSFVATKPKQPV